MANKPTSAGWDLLKEHADNSALRKLADRVSEYYAKKADLERTNLRHEEIKKELLPIQEQIKQGYKEDLAGLAAAAAETINREKTKFLKRETADPAKQLLWFNTRKLEIDSMTEDQKNDLATDYIHEKTPLDRHSINMLITSFRDPSNADRLRTIATENRYDQPWLKEPGASEADYFIRSHSGINYNEFRLTNIPNQVGDEQSGPVGYYISQLFDDTGAE